MLLHSRIALELARRWEWLVPLLRPLLLARHTWTALLLLLPQMLHLHRLPWTIAGRGSGSLLLMMMMIGLQVA